MKPPVLVRLPPPTVLFGRRSGKRFQIAVDANIRVSASESHLNGESVSEGAIDGIGSSSGVEDQTVFVVLFENRL